MKLETLERILKKAVAEQQDGIETYATAEEITKKRHPEFDKKDIKIQVNELRRIGRSLHQYPEIGLPTLAHMLELGAYDKDKSGNPQVKGRNSKSGEYILIKYQGTTYRVQ